ncbi:hypothetical protein M569_08723, partial [Genlisea aurea]
AVAGGERKPHALCIPFPAQGHITPMLNLSKLLHEKGFHVTFVNTHYNHRRLIKSLGADAVSGLPGFLFASIPDGLPPSDADVTQDVPSLLRSTHATCLEPLCELIRDLNKESPPVSCIVSDGILSFTLAAAERFRLPEVLFWTASACGLLGYMQYPRLVEQGIVPFNNKKQVTDGAHLEKVIDWVPGVNGGLRLRDFPSFVRTTDPRDVFLNFAIQEATALGESRAVGGLILNTFDALEEGVLTAMAEILPPPIYTVGPLNLLLDRLPESPLAANLWKEETDCIEWLDGRKPRSVLYVNFGAVAAVTPSQLTEFAWGLANSGHPFLWTIRPDILSGENPSAVLPPEFLTETGDRSKLSSWVPQEKVLSHAAIGGFLTHCGWNSMVESISHGVPMICWPYFAEQPTNCRFGCVEWGIGMEIGKNANREEVENVIREIMEGEKGKKMKENAAEWQKKAAAATSPGGSSEVNLNRFIEEVLM